MEFKGQTGNVLVALSEMCFHCLPVSCKTENVSLFTNSPNNEEFDRKVAFVKECIIKYIGTTTLQPGY